MSKALKAAIEANDPVAVRTALKAVKDLRRKLPKAEAPLAYAAKFGADAVISALLQAGAPMPDTGYEGDHPFAVAAEADHQKVLAALAAHSIPDKVIQHVLFTAVLSGKREVVRTILENCRPLVPQRVLSVS